MTGNAEDVAVSVAVNEDSNAPGQTSSGAFLLVNRVVRGGVEPPTYRFSGGRSYQLSYLTSPTGVGSGPDGT